MIDTRTASPREGRPMPEAGSKGDLLVWRVANPPASPCVWPVGDPHEAAILIEALANKDLCDPTVTDNAYGLVEWDGTEWLEWEDAEGSDIRAVADARLPEVGVDHEINPDFEFSRVVTLGSSERSATVLVYASSDGELTVDVADSRGSVVTIKMKPDGDNDVEVYES